MQAVFVHNLHCFFRSAMAPGLLVAMLASPFAAQAQTIRDKLFANPTNIEINLTYLQQQLGGGNFALFLLCCTVSSLQL